MASITIYVPDEEPIAYELDAVEQLSIGRGPDNDVVLDHVSLSGSHASIQNLGGTFQLNDLGSTNGTYVNGDQITEEVLGNGARIQFGSVEAVFADEASAGAEAGGDVGDGSASSGYGSHHAELAEVSNRPSGFTNLSPIEKVEKKDVLSLVAVLLGVLAILAAIAVAGIATTMSAV